MTRSGPNQDINDLIFLENLRNTAESVDVIANDFNLANNGITGEKARYTQGRPLVHPDNPRLIPISTLLKKEDGSEVAISGFTTSGTYKQSNLDLYTESVINTHIFQPERFREYYSDLVSIANSWSNVDNSQPNTDSYVIQQIVHDDGDIKDGSATVWIDFKQKDGLIAPDVSQVPVEIDWEGTGPTNYTSGTYAQLWDEFGNLGAAMGGSIQPYFDAGLLVSLGKYVGFDEVAGLRKIVVLKERSTWSTNTQPINRQAFSQTFTHALQGSLQFPEFSFDPLYTFRIPIMISNFTNSSLNIPYTIEVTMIPRTTSGGVFNATNAGFVNKIIAITKGFDADQNTSYVVHAGGDPTSANNAITSTFSLQLSGSSFIIKKSLEVVEFKISVINQASVRLGSYSDWDIGNFLSDINIKIDIDGKTFDQTFAHGLERSMWS
jgi:hypothetical protein